MASCNNPLFHVKNLLVFNYASAHKLYTCASAQFIKFLTPAKVIVQK